MQSKKLWLTYLASNKARVIVVLILGIISNISTILLPLSLGKFIEIVFVEQTNKSKVLEILGIYLPNTLNAFIIFFVGIMFIKLLSSFFHNYYSSIVGDAFVQHLRRLLIKHHLENEGEMLKAKRNNSILLIFTSEVKTVQRYLVKGIIGFGKDIFLIIIAIYVLASINTFLSFFISLLIITFYVLLKFINKRFKPYYADKRNCQAKMIGFIVKKVTSGNTENDVTVLKEYDDMDASFIEIKRQYIIRKSFLAAITPFFLSMLLLAVMLCVLFANKENAVSASVVLIYTLVLITVFSTIRNLLKVETLWVEGKLAIRKFNRVFLMIS